MAIPREDNRFPRALRLPAGAPVDRLFAFGKGLSNFPLRLVYYAMEPVSGKPPELRVVISVPKRQVRKAHDRNLIKRRLREIYRQNIRTTLLPAVQRLNLPFHVCVIYTGGKQIFSFADLEVKLISSLERLAKRIIKEHGIEPPPDIELSKNAADGPA